MTACFYVKKPSYQNMLDVEVLAFGDNMLIKGINVGVKEVPIDFNLLENSFLTKADVISIIEENGEQVEVSLTTEMGTTKHRTGYNTNAVLAYLQSELVSYNPINGEPLSQVLGVFNRMTTLTVGTTPVHINQNILAVMTNVLQLDKFISFLEGND